MTHVDAGHWPRISRIFALVLGIAAILSPPLAMAQVQDSAQQKCINALNKSGVKVALTQAKEGSRCLGAAAKGLEADAQACLTADAKGKVGKAEAGTVSADGKCTTAPSFGKTTATAVNTAAVNEQASLVADLFGASLTTAVLPSASNQAGAKCQAAVLKGTGKLTATLLKSFLACKKNGLKSSVPGEQIDVRRRPRRLLRCVARRCCRQDRQGRDQVRGDGRQELHPARGRARDGLSRRVHGRHHAVHRLRRGPRALPDVSHARCLGRSDASL